jgi:hypothetical protein
MGRRNPGSRAACRRTQAGRLTAASIYSTDPANEPGFSFALYGMLHFEPYDGRFRSWCSSEVLP